jgi:isopentenyl-diphosphate Delta-isomerase
MANIQVDENDQVIGVRPIEDFFTGRYIHRSSHLILLNSENEILLQKRSPKREWYPGLYTYSASGAVAEETYEECVQKEMQEELGISIPVKYLFKYKYFDEHDKSFHAIFVGKSDSDIRPDEDEASEVKWFSVSELKRGMKSNPELFVPHLIIGMNKYFTEFYKVKK